MRGGRRSVDREQGSRDGGVGSAPAIQKLCAVGDLLREGMPEGVLTRRLGGTEKLGGRKALERRGELGRGQIDHGAQQLDRHVSPDHGRGLEHVLVAVREPIDARREDGLNGLGQRDLLDRGGQLRRRRVHRAARHARRASESSPRRRVGCREPGPRSDRAGARACRRIRASRRATSGSPGERGAQARDPRPGRTTAGRYSGRVVASSRTLLPADSGARRRSVSISSASFARRVEPVQVLDPEQRELAPSSSLDQLEKRPEETCAARFGIES